MKRQVILCGGGHRSGSTWQYNAVRAILRESGIEPYGAWVDAYDAARPEAVHVIKMHDPGAMLRFADARAVGCYRDLRDVACSLDRMGWLRNGLGAGIRRLIDRMSRMNRYFVVARALDRYVRSNASWAERAVYMMRYEEMMASPVQEVRRLAEAIGFPLAEAQVRRVVEHLTALRPPGDEPLGTADGVDRETMLHPGHFSRAPEYTDARLRRFVTKRYGNWLKAHNYGVD